MKSYPHSRLLLATTALTSSLMVVVAQAQNLPTGGSVAAGGVTVAAPTPTQMSITQTTPSGVVNWQSFSVGQGYAVNIQQPDSTSALLNRVTGNTPSTIAGSITANGQVYLVNPNGIAITSTGVVNTGGFVASTLGISDSDFMAGKRTFTGSGASAGVSNAGTITTGRGGYAALIGGTVENSGNILVPLGKVALGSGERATLDFSGDGFLQVAVPTATKSNDALIRNSGTIRADGGSVIISAATARDAARNAVNISGIVQARTIGGRTGSIVIGGGLGGAVKISGTVAATARKATGGAVAITGQDITFEGAIIDVTGKTGGGTILIGGGRQGEGPLQHADTLTVDAATTIRSDATTAGNGGDVVLWSDQLTMFAGTVSARGGFQSGNGGEAEVSGKSKLGYTGFTDLSATNGAFGTLLLDPYNVTISAGANNTGGSFNANTDDSIINASTLQTALGAANVTITTGAGGTQTGNITVAAPLTWSTATTLSLTAAGGIAINAPITITGAGGLALTATAQAGITTTGLTFGNGASVDYGATDTGGTFRLNGQNYTLIYSMAQLDAIDGVNAVDGSALALHGEGLTGKYALATSLDANGTTYTQALVATNSTDDVSTQFTGRLDGLGHTVTGLTIDAPSLGWVGLLGFVSGANASVSNIGLVGGSVSGRSDTGSLVGWLEKGVVQNSFSGVSVTSSEQNTGGLIGFSAGGTVQSSHASGTVSSPYVVGGLIGWSDASGVVINSYATGAVTGDNGVGGLLGYNDGSVSNSHATGAVTSNEWHAGGLIGLNGGTVQSSHASGTVNSISGAGGLLGGNEALGVVTDSYATGAVTGQDEIGGLVGVNTGLVSNSYATGAVTSSHFDAGGLIGYNAGTVQSSHASGAVSGFFVAGGLIGWGESSSSVTDSYATGVVVAGNDSAGGLMGYNAGQVSDSYATGTATAMIVVGGLIGESHGTVTNSYATGAVTANEQWAGGLVGYNGGVVSNSHATGAVTGAEIVGGLIGENIEGGSITNSYATGVVSGANEGGGLIGANSGDVSNSHATGAVTMTANAGGLIGANSGVVQNSYATGAVMATGSQVGGLIGINDGTVSGSFATGAVAATQFVGGLIGISTLGTVVQDSYATGSVTGTINNIGGLIGRNQGVVRATYATGAVLGKDRTGGLVGYNFGGTVQSSYATGTVFGETSTGGLVGQNSQSAIVRNTYATGAVTGTGQGTGGLIGANATSSTVETSYATGRVVGQNDVAGLVGHNTAATVSASYWNSETSGQATGIGFDSNNQQGNVIGLTTAQLQGAMPAGFDAATWSTGAGLYAYLNWQFAAGTTPQSISGIAYQSDGTVLAGATVAGTRDGKAFDGTTGTGANGYYYFLLPQGSTAQGSGVFIDIAGNAVKSNAYVQGASAPVQNLDLRADLLTVRTDATTLSGVASGIVSAAGSTPTTDLVFTTSGGVLTPNAGTGVSLTAAGAFTIDQNLVVPNAVTINSAGILTVASSGSLSSSNGDATLVAGSSFVNNRGASAVSAANGRWLVYSADPRNDTRGGLAYDFKQYAATYGVTSVAQATGNGFLYTVVPTAGLSGTVSKTYDGNTSVTGSPSINGAGIDGEVLGITYTGLAYENANAGTGKTVTADGVAITSVTDGSASVYGYVLGSTTVTGAIGAVTPRAITVTADAQSRTYGDANPALTYAVGGLGLVNSDSLTGGLATAATTATGVGSYGIAQGDLAASSNYAVTYFGANLVVTPRAITVTADAQSRTYGDANPALTYAVDGLGLVNSDSLTGGLATAATTTTGVGSYGITQGDLAASANYALTYVGANLAVTARAITVTADAQSRTYGDANPALTYAVGGLGLVNSDSLTGGLATAATTTSGVGSYGITQGDLAASANYALTYVGANLAVTARAITVTANAQSRTYGDANPALTYAVGGLGLVNSDSLTGGLATVAATATGVGSYGITQGDLAASANYALTYVGANLAVTARAITVTADAQSRTYGDANPALTYAVGGLGLVNSDSLTGGLATAATTATGVGSYGIAQGDLAASSNYALTYVGANLAVTARAITVTADAQSRTYGDANPALTYAVGGLGLVNSDSLTGGLATAATTATGVGSYGIAQGDLAASSNYAVTYVGANLAVTARAITVTADAQSRTYGDANPALTYAVGGLGLVNSDGLTGGLATTATPASAIGSYAITEGTLVDAVNPNYAIAYTGADLTVVAAAPAAAPTDGTAPVPSSFILPTSNVTQPNSSVINLQSDQSGTGSITPLTTNPVRVASEATQPTPTTQPQQTAAAQNADDEIVTGSIGPQAIKSADGFIYRPISQYDATQYSNDRLPGYEGEAGDATVVAMLLRGTQRSNDTPKIDQLFEPGKGLQWKGVNWENPVADKVGFSDGAGQTGAAGESFPLQTGATDLAGLLGKGVVILTASAKEPNSASFPLLGIAMTAQGLVANDPSTGRQVLVGYNAETKALGAISSVLDAKTGNWIKLADVKPADGGLSQAQLDQLAKLSVDRFVAVGVAAAGAR